MISIMENLNSQQKKAVQKTDGPVLIIAGAGSGKTRVLTYRIAFLINEKKVSPGNILAVTFTNKAAQEMKERVAKLLYREDDYRFKKIFQNGFQPISETSSIPMIGTFHSICAKILRAEIKNIGYENSFSILDDQDQLAMVKKIMREMKLDTEQIKPRAILGKISSAKNEFMDLSLFTKQATGYFEEIVAKIYANYQKNLQKQNVLDFDDLLLLTVKIFQKYPEVLEKYQDIFRYIMIDEYQDTNRIQYVLVKLLSQKRKNLCVVGDDFQAIYGWRGADIQNILDFEKDYPDTKVIKMEQNYRSTQNILDAAYDIISKNVRQKDKKIWTNNSSGHLITQFEAKNEIDEAEFLAKEIQYLHKEKNYEFSDFVILYRTNAQSRAIEEAMLKNSLPYKIIGGIKFYQRKEIKDVIAYLKLIQNFNDEISLERIANFPKRNIGKISLQKWINFCKKNSLDFINGATQLSTKENLNIKKIEAIKKFGDFILEASEKSSSMNLKKFLEFIFVKSGLEKNFLEKNEEGEIQLENVKELLTVAQKYAEYENGSGIAEFLEEVALLSEADGIDKKNEAVHLLTLHSAKGLEFKVVFIVGLEEGILPHSRSLLDSEQMEEERRLMYVGITRAQEKVYLVFANQRNIFGSTQINIPSRFMDDISEKLLLKNKKDKEIFFEKKKNQKNTVSKTKNQTDFKDGDYIIHETFGKGLIVASHGDILTVAFSLLGLKKISASIAPIHKINSNQ